jgi:hypothetical protein
MVVDINETMLEYNLLKEGKMDKEKSSLSTSILGCIFAPLQSSKIGEYITEYKTPWLRYE